MQILLAVAIAKEHTAAALANTHLISRWPVALANFNILADASTNRQGYYIYLHQLTVCITSLAKLASIYRPMFRISVIVRM